MKFEKATGGDPFFDLVVVAVCVLARIIFLRDEREYLSRHVISEP